MSADKPTASDPLRTVARKQDQVIRSSATLRQLAEAMTAQSVSALVVTKRDGTRAVVTERDIVRALGNGSDPDDDWAVDVMSMDLRTLTADDSILDAARLMRDAVIRHVVVHLDDEDLALVSLRGVLVPLINTAEA